MEPLINILTRFFLLCAGLERFSTSFYYVIKNSAGNKNFYIKFEFKMQNKFRLKRHFSKKHTRGFSYNKFSALSLQSRREGRSAKSKHRWRSQITSSLDEAVENYLSRRNQTFYQLRSTNCRHFIDKFPISRRCPCAEHFHCRHSALDESLCKDILLFYVNEVEHNNLYLERK